MAEPIPARSGPPVSRLANRVPPSETPDLTSLLGLAVGVVIVAALSIAREVLIPLTLAVLLAFVLGPIVALLRRFKVPRALAVMVAALIALGVVAVIGTIIGGQIAALTGDIPRYATTIEHKIDAAREFAAKHTSALSNSIGNMGAQAPQKPQQSQTTPAAPAPTPVEVHNPPPGPLQVIQTCFCRSSLLWQLRQLSSSWRSSSSGSRTIFETD